MQWILHTCDPHWDSSSQFSQPHPPSAPSAEVTQHCGGWNALVAHALLPPPGRAERLHSTRACQANWLTPSVDRDCVGGWRIAGMGNLGVPHRGAASNLGPHWGGSPDMEEETAGMVGVGVAGTGRAVVPVSDQQRAHGACRIPCWQWNRGLV